MNLRSTGPERCMCPAPGFGFLPNCPLHNGTYPEGHTMGLLNDPRLTCVHPPEQRVTSPDRPAQSLCGKCGAVVQGLDEKLLLDTMEHIRKDVRRK